MTTFIYFCRDCTQYVEWLNSLYNASGDIEKTKEAATKYSEKLDDFETKIEETMETFFTYDGLYSELNKSFEEANYNRNQIKNLNADIINSIDEGNNLVEEARGCLLDAQNNFEVRFS